MNEKDKDEYDISADYLYQHPEELEFAWQFPGDSPGGFLFTNAGTVRYAIRQVDVNGKNHFIGDPIRIRGYNYAAESEYVTGLIRKDDRLPNSIDECRLEHLPILAEWQRYFDRVYHRPHPTRKVFAAVVDPEPEVIHESGDEINVEIDEPQEEPHILTLCLNCDHFIDENHDEEAVEKYIHLDDGEQEYNHVPQPGEKRTLAEWQKLRPDLFVEHEDGKIGPNSSHHSRRGKEELCF